MFAIEIRDAGAAEILSASENVENRNNELCLKRSGFLGL